MTVVIRGGTPEGPAFCYPPGYTCYIFNSDYTRGIPSCTELNTAPASQHMVCGAVGKWAVVDSWGLASNTGVQPQIHLPPQVTQ